MNISIIDIGTVIAVLSLFFKLSTDKASNAEEMGRMKQQIKSLETRASKIDTKLESIDEKLGNLITAMARLEGILGQNQQ